MGLILIKTVDLKGVQNGLNPNQNRGHRAHSICPFRGTSVVSGHHTRPPLPALYEELHPGYFFFCSSL
jgi:hypothetical protein